MIKNKGDSIPVANEMTFCDALLALYKIGSEPRTINRVINDPKVNMQSQPIKFVGVKMMKHL